MKSLINHKFLILIVFCIIHQSYETAEDDLVKNLPDYSYKGRLYSGYLDVDSVKKFHYMFNLAYQDPDHKPLVLWMNGGPGCSSLDGWASEHGPMQMDDDGVFQMNEYSWNRAANMIYLESPGDVGFSYIDSQLDYELRINDDISGQDNLQAVLSFFKKFPSFKGRDFYISGESYAGIYVPTLAYNILKYNEGVSEAQKINLKGILVGNGVADWNYDTTNAMIDFAFSHHLYSYELRKQYNTYCVTDYEKEQCEKIYEKIGANLENINVYDYLRECYIPTTSNGHIDENSSYYKHLRWVFEHNGKKFNRKKESKKVYSILDEEERRESNVDVPCIDDTKITAYFNREDVKNALHVNVLNRDWEMCSSPVYERYEILGKGSIWTYPTLIKSGLRILIYNGDTDLAVPFNGNQAWISNLKLEVITPWHAWRAYDDPENISGYVTKYQGLTFCTIKGTGHMTPQWKPKESYYMFYNFLNEQDF